MEPAPKRPSLSARGWSMPSSLAGPAATPRAPSTPAPAVPPTAPAPSAGGTPFSRLLTANHLGSTGAGCGGTTSRTSWSAGSRVPRSRLGSGGVGAEDIESGSEEENVPGAPPAGVPPRRAAPQPVPPFPSFDLAHSDPDGPVPPPPADETRRRSCLGQPVVGRAAGGMVAGLNLTSEQLGPALPAGSSRGNSSRRAHGPFEQQAQRALLAVEADRSMLNARHALGGSSRLSCERLKRALGTPGLAVLVLRAVGCSDVSQPLVALACERLHPPPPAGTASPAATPSDGQPLGHVTVLVHRTTYLTLSAGGAAAPADLLVLPPWLERAGAILAQHCQGLEPGAAAEALGRAWASDVVMV